MGDANIDNQERDPLVDRAIRLFEFLARGQQLKVSSPRTVESYHKDGSVLWLANLPEHPAVITVLRDDVPPAGSELLSLDRIPQSAPPAPDDTVTSWLSEPGDDPAKPPLLLETKAAPDGSEIAAPSGIRASYDHWIDEWRAWAAKELRDQPVRALYGELFSTYVTANGRAEELELVAGIGCLTWAPPSHDPVKRHLLTTPVAIEFDDDTGRLTVRHVESVDTFTVELDMLEPGLIAGPAHINPIRDEARQLEAHPLDRGALGALARRLVHALDAEGVYHPDQDDPGAITPQATAAFAPAIVLRKRSRQGLVEILQTIAAQLTEAGQVPDGLLPLIDPNHRPSSRPSPEPGALVMVDDDPFLPLPVNDVQLRILRTVDTAAQTLVQGPPGTGKTHTAAALLSHLLAQGKRVLVTAHTDRALKEVRDKLPAEIRPLSVAVVGTSREDMSDLKVAVDRIGAASAEHDPNATEKTIGTCLDRIDQLRRQRATLHRDLVNAREYEVLEHEHAGYRGTLAGISEQLEAAAVAFAWLEEFAEVRPSDSAPLSSEEISRWRAYLLDEHLAEDESEARQRQIDPALLPEPAQFADLVAAERSAIAEDERNLNLRNHPAYAAVHRLDHQARTQLQRNLGQLAGDVGILSRRRETWMSAALADVCSGRAGVWQARSRQIAGLIGRVGSLLGRLGPTTEVVVAEGELGPLAALAAGLLEYLNSGRKVKTGQDGTPKIGSFAAKEVKQAQPLLDQVRVHHLPPTTAGQLSAFLIWVEAVHALTALDRAWPDNTSIPHEDTLHERLQWHVTELIPLNQVLGLGQACDAEERRLATSGLPIPNWTDPEAVSVYGRLGEVAAVAEKRVAASKPLTYLEEVVEVVARWDEAAPSVRRLLTTVRERDFESYAAAHARLKRLADVSTMIDRRDTLGESLRLVAPALCTAIEQSPVETSWNERLDHFEEAWAWVSTSAWVAKQNGSDINVLQAEVALLEGQIRQQVETLSAARAWGHAVSPSRLTGEARADLSAYAYLVRRLGKGTGSYATQRQAEIRQAMERCRPAVPVWIMPIYRIAEQFRVQPDMFDVVIVDEASQAGLEATFLQYLAPKIVVIGDDRQVSPAGVGIDQQQLRDLAAQYLPDDRYRSSWQDPQRSLFDEAKMRYGSPLTLVEHRRCVPEIIGFSNRIAYEPDGIRLIPVRQYGADRLDPIKAVFLADGYSRGTTSKVNQVEVEAIVEQIEKCIADPRYDGLTFGVISLLGPTQAKIIQSALMDRIPPEEWTARDLRCGDSADFQGSERDVMFLSMVAAPEPGKRQMPLTRDLYVQRYNVAASRAKDQMWVFHSVQLSDLANPEDMRFHLLDYCYGVINRVGGDEGGGTAVVPEDRQVDPFDSLFEQRVFNRLIDRGYTVFPQYPAEGYKIDLVVLGARSRLAIECDGDFWHGPEAYERDLARQRDLERCGWEFFRIRGSAFYLDKAAALEELWSTLHERDIHPSGWQPAEPAQPDLVSSEVEQPIITHIDEHDPLEDDEEIDQPTISLASTKVSGSTLAEYETFGGTLVPVAEASRQQLMDGILKIVEMEGPMLGVRLQRAYVLASGGQKVGSAIAKMLNSVITGAVRRGLLIVESPLGETGVQPRTYRLPEQDPVRIRELGPRTFELIPPQELAALTKRAADEHSRDNNEQLYRAVLELLGLKQLTAKVTARLDAISPLTHN